MYAVAIRPSAQRPSAQRPSGQGPRPRRATRSTGLFLRRRVGVAVATMVLAVVGVAISSTRFADAGQARPVGDGPVGASVVIVQPGDTLWSLARQVQPDGDIRPLVAQFSRAHGGSSLSAGERIVVPAP